MASKEYQIVVSAIGKGIRATTKSLSDGFTRGQRAVAAFNATARKSRQVSDRLTGSIKGMIGAYAGWQSVSGVVNAISQADQAAFNLSTSVAAANREFDNVGTVDSWNATISELSDRLKVYSDTALKNAISRTVDMTKRLGLEENQMQELIARAGDLGAGKVDLEGAIERVSAAMRGEAESAEYLGLTLNENYIKAWHEANSATQTAWKDLTDVQKAQVRYQVFLEQTNEMQGRAAASAKTLGGAWQLVQKEITNSIVNNESAADAMARVAESLRENADEIGNLIANIIDLTVRAGEFALKWKNVIFVILGTSVIYTVLSKLIMFIKGINAAFAVMTGMGLISWFGKLRVALGGIEAAFLAGKVSAVAFYAAATAGAVWGISKIIELGKAIYGAVQAHKEMVDIQKRLESNTRQLQQRFKDFADVEVPGDLTKLAQDDLDALADKLRKSQAYWTAYVTGLQQQADKKTILGTATDEARAAQAELPGAVEKLRSVKAALRDIQNTDALTDPVKDLDDAILASKEQMDAFRDSAEAAYKAAAAEAEKYGQKIKDLNQSIADRELSLQDKIRDLRRQNMNEQQAAADLRLEAVEKERAAREALAQFQQSGSQRDLNLAKRFADQAESAWTEYANGGKQATEAAISGLERVNNILDQADKTQINTFAQMKHDAESAMADVKHMVDEINASVEFNLPIELENLKQVRDEINDLIKDETKHITIKTTEAKAAGGRVGMASGGRFPGNSKRDSIPVLARPGEGFVRNEALKVWDRMFGKGFFDGINAPWSKSGRTIMDALTGGMQIRLPDIKSPAPRMAYATGGRVAGVNPANMGTINLQLGNNQYPLHGDRNVIEELQNEITRQKRRRPNKT